MKKCDVSALTLLTLHDQKKAYQYVLILKVITYCNIPTPNYTAKVVKESVIRETLPGLHKQTKIYNKM